MKAAILEARIRKAVDLALGAWASGAARNAVVRGVWDEAGIASRGPNLKPVGVTVDVAVSPASYERFEQNKASFDCSLAVTFNNMSSIAAETTVKSTCSTLERLLFSWLVDREALESDLGADGLRPFAAVPSGGIPPTYDRQTDSWSVTLSFTVKAVVTYSDLTE